ncbi:MAG: RIP metalloprotease RseP [Thiomargarita sp.]|nr:RIP metalloprotease RseP [Thiomargarita sp.]
MSIIQTLLVFIVVIGILVTVHEFGHYIVARLLGVKILRFSVGFGKPLWMKRFGKDQTEFVIAPIPLGGYVKMLGEDKEEEIAPEDKARAFSCQPLSSRAAIVFAGPLFNFLFAIIAYALMFMSGITGMKALVGEVSPQSIAEQAGFQSSYQIVAVNEQPALRWESVIQITLKQLLSDNNDIIYTVKNNQGNQYDLAVNLTGFSLDDIAEGEFFNKLGLQPYRSPLPAIMGKIMPDSPAEQAGLKSGDKIIAVDNESVDNWNSFVEYVRERPEQSILTTIERQQQQLKITLIPKNVDGIGKMGVYNYFFVSESYTFIPAFIHGMNKTWDMSVLTLQVMAKMLTLQVSYKHISGPITIAEYAGKSAQMGIAVFLSFLGLVSVSLAVINLLPIPILDGGHLFFYLIEWIKGNPVSEKTEYFLQQVGIILLFGLMMLAIFNDLTRLFN